MPRCLTKVIQALADRKCPGTVVVPRPRAQTSGIGLSKNDEYRQLQVNHGNKLHCREVVKAQKVLSGGVEEAAAGVKAK